MASRRMIGITRRPAIIACSLAFALSLAACGSLGEHGSGGATATPGPLEPNGPISWSEAQSRIGERLTAEGLVISVQDIDGDLLLNVGGDESEPGRLVVVIPSTAREKFPSDPEVAYADQLVRVRGTIVSRDGVAAIIVKRPGDLKGAE